MSDLLRRYPDVSGAEKLQLVDFLKQGHPETLAMVTYGSGLVPQAGKVKKDHPKHFPSAWRILLPWLGVLGLALLLLAQLFWAGFSSPRGWYAGACSLR